MTLSSIAAPVSSALQAYLAAGGSSGGTSGITAPRPSSFAELASLNTGATPSGGLPKADFGTMVTNALRATVDSGHAAETAATQAVKGDGNLIDVVSAVSKAELSLQTTIAIRDRVVSAYQDIMHLAI